MTTKHRTRAQTRQQSDKPQTPGPAFGIQRSSHHFNTPTPIFTPRADRLKFRLQLKDSDEEDDYYTEGLEEILGSTWTLYRVSPLHNFSYNKIRLKQYGLHLREYLTNMKPDFGKVKIKYVTEFSKIPGLTQTEYDYDAVKIEVKYVLEEKPSSTSYLSFLISRGATQRFTNENFVHLPVLLCRGSLGTITSVHMVLQKYFDCSIQQLSLTQDDLIWLNATFLSLCSKWSSSSEVQYTYVIPHCPSSDNIILNIPVAFLIRVWKSIHKSDLDDILYKEAKDLHDGIEEHFYKILGINVGQCQLIKLKLPDIAISTAGKLKVKKVDLVDNLLNFLYNVATLIENSTPSLGLKVN